MKKILTQTALFTIGALISIPINFLILRDWIHSLTIAISISIAFLIVNLLTKYVTITNIKKLFWWIKYKRIKEVVKGECDGCILYDTVKTEDCISSGRTRTCLNTKTILAKRNYNIFKWIKKLFILCVIAILSVSCVTINVYKSEPQKTTPADSTQIESYWF